MKKILVAYFSASGVTKKAAKTLAEAAKADLFQIVPKDLYTKADLNWMNKSSRSSVEMNDPASRPEIADKIENLQDYDIVFIGFPIWWYTAPRIIDTFLESYDFSGKTLIPFATSGGSGLGKTEDDLKAVCHSHAKWLPGKMLNGRVSEKSISDWLGKLDI